MTPYITKHKVPCERLQEPDPVPSPLCCYFTFWKKKSHESFTFYFHLDESDRTTVSECVTYHSYSNWICTWRHQSDLNDKHLTDYRLSIGTLINWNDSTNSFFLKPFNLHFLFYYDNIYVFSRDSNYKKVRTYKIKVFYYRSLVLYSVYKNNFQSKIKNVQLICSRDELRWTFNEFNLRKNTTDLWESFRMDSFRSHD